MIALNTYEKGRKEDILVHKHELLLFSKLAFPSYSLAELVTKSGFLAQVSGVEGEEKKNRTRLKVLLLCSLFSPVQPDIVLRERGLAALPSQQQHGSPAGQSHHGAALVGFAITPLHFLLNQVGFVSSLPPDLCRGPALRWAGVTSCAPGAAETGPPTLSWHQGAGTDLA